MARRMGITSLTRQDYGLALTLGGGDVSTPRDDRGVRHLCQSGLRVPPVAITKIVDYDGKVVYQYKAPAVDQVIRPEHAFLISDILSDNKARTPMFGTNSVLNIGFPAAVKTGSKTNDYRDNWTLGYTPDLAVGVWVGNADDSAMVDSTGVTGAAPIWSKFMKFAIQAVTGGNPTPFVNPAGSSRKSSAPTRAQRPRTGVHQPAQRILRIRPAAAGAVRRLSQESIRRYVDWFSGFIRVPRFSGG